MSDEPGGAGRGKLVVAASFLVLFAATAVVLLQAPVGVTPVAAHPATRSSAGGPGSARADVSCQGDAAACRRVLGDPALADEVAAQGPAGDTRQLAARVQAALPADPDKRTACEFGDQSCIAKPPPVGVVRRALTAAGISGAEVQATGPVEDSPNGVVYVGIRHGPGCLVVRLRDYTPVFYNRGVRPDGTCLPA